MNLDRCEPLTNYHFLVNDEDEIMAAIPGYFPGEPDSPVILYDGGDDAIFIRNGNDSLLLDCIHSEVRPMLESTDSVLIWELDSKYQYQADVIHRSIKDELRQVRSEMACSFPLHPFPIHTGAFIRERTVCSICGRGTGLSFRAGLLHCRKPQEENSPICPSCIQSGRAAQTLGGCFTPVYRLNDPETGNADEVMFRTPSYYAAGSVGYWPDHCGSACIYLGKILLEDMNPELFTELFNLDEASDAGQDGASEHDASPRYNEGLRILADIQAGKCEPHMFRCPKCNRHILQLAETEEMQYPGH